MPLFVKEWHEIEKKEISKLLIVDLFFENN